MLTLRNSAFFLLVAASFSHADPLTNLVTNGGFETGSFSGWSVAGTVTPCLFVGTSNDSHCIPTTGYGAHTGAYAAELGNGGGDAVLSQTISTSGSGTYEISFWLASQNYGTVANDFSVTWGGTTLLSGANLPAFGYTHYDFTGLAAAGPATVLAFTFRNDPSYFALDDVSVVDPPNGVPEPRTSLALPLLLAGLMAFACRARRGNSVRI